MGLMGGGGALGLMRGGYRTDGAGGYGTDGGGGFETDEGGGDLGLRGGWL